MIEEIKKYTDEKDRSVKAYIPIQKEADLDLLASPHYEGTVGIQTPMGVMPVDFPFPNDYTLNQCFENFEDIAKEEVKKIVEEQQEKNRIITPDQHSQSTWSNKSN